jgi:NADH:ubiquinone oxidoreductase subunit H
MNLNLLDPRIIVLVAVVILMVAVLVVMYLRKRRSTTADLRQRFGPEYDGRCGSILFEELVQVPAIVGRRDVA